MTVRNRTWEAKSAIFCVERYLIINKELLVLGEMARNTKVTSKCFH